MPVVPEILIVGDESRRSGLATRVRDIGYDAAACGPDDVGSRLSGGPAPAAIVVCLAGTDAALLMAGLRRTPQGAAIPVTLCGELGGEVRDLADVLDLGADHFLEEPVGDEQLVSTLQALAGPPSAPEASAPVRAAAAPEPASDADSDAAVVSEAWPMRTEVIAEPDAGVGAKLRTAAERSASRSDPVIGQLHRTLDMLEERLRERDANRSPSDSHDDLDLSQLGMRPVPGVDDDGEVPDPGWMEAGDSGHRLAALSDALAAGAYGTGDHDSSSRQIGPRESTVMLENAVVHPDSAERDSTAPRALDGDADLLDRRGVEPQPSPRTATGRVLHDRPRRSVPLPVEREGSLSAVEVPRLIWRLHQARYTGQLRLVRGRVEKTVWFDRGNVVFARSNLGQDRLIDGLLRRGLLTRQQHETARRLAAKEPRRAGQLLVEAGFLKPNELPRILRDHLARTVDSTFPWNEGAWALTPNVACDESVLLEAPTSLIVMHGVRNRMETAQLWALLGGPRQYPRLRPDVAQGHEAELAEALMMSPSEEAWLPRLTGDESLEELTVDRAVDELEVLALTYGLHVLGFVDLVGEPQAQPAEEHDPDSVDRARIDARLRLCREADYFAVLGLDRAATRVDVRRAYTELSSTFRDPALEPDTVRSLASELSELRAALAEARDVLADDALRNAYLAHLEEP